MTETVQATRRQQHITTVSETFPPEINGVANTLGHLCRGLVQRGHRVSVIRPRQQYKSKGRFASAGEALFTREHVVTGFPLPGYADLRFGLVPGRRLKNSGRPTGPGCTCSAVHP